MRLFLLALLLVSLAGAAGAECPPLSTLAPRGEAAATPEHAQAAARKVMEEGAQEHWALYEQNAGCIRFRKIYGMGYSGGFKNLKGREAVVHTRLEKGKTFIAVELFQIHLRTTGEDLLVSIYDLDPNSAEFGKAIQLRAVGTIDTFPQWILHQTEKAAEKLERKKK